ncbi:BTB/POZ domain-containing protein KCTD9 [Aricia agestis]|uniref:BTB/POZ domain-containing protein KCTD9 n=1 Tax=Aricia agestis TaxID=91739 RepID=UPI001C20C299|nr:BTB/POZ domain-containing protein KCTD9 [Aricia agestis]
MKRAFVFKDASERNGKVMVVEDTIKDFKKQIAIQYDLSEENFKIYLDNGCEIDDVRVIRENDKIYLSLEGLKNSDTHSKSCETLENGMKVFSVSNEKERTISDWIMLNVGGKYFVTSRSTLVAKEPLSMLARMFDNDLYLNPSPTDSKGAYLIDRSPEYFEPILNYLRHGEVILDKNINPKGVLEEAIFYGVDSMIAQLKQIIEESTKHTDNNQPLTRNDVIRSIIMTSTKEELRFQGVNLAGADLNRLDLRYINFKYACLAGCNLSHANLSFCCLERADLSAANLEGAQLLGIKALCANMEGAILKGCNMEDPARSKTVLEGVNLKGANLECSNMSSVNLRLASLKNANLQNCVLRCAELAGADLECCDLSGSDLHEANLRGANLKDAAFELMLTPLHMSQTIR